MAQAADTEIQPITQRYIFSFWLPLAASWALMALEGPFVQAAIARLPDPETHLAAFGIVVSLSITIESPIIMLLATSTALCRDRAAYRVLHRFMLWLNLFVTVVAAVVAFTPVYAWVVPGLRDPTGESGRFIGQGFDVRVRTQLGRHVGITLGYAYFHPGEFVRNTTEEANASNFVYVAFLVRF